jgi:hypothetical protein
MLHDQPTDKQAQPEKIMTIIRLHNDPHYPLVMPLLPLLYCRFRYYRVRYERLKNVDRIVRRAAIRPVPKSDQAQIRKELR